MPIYKFTKVIEILVKLLLLYTHFIFMIMNDHFLHYNKNMSRIGNLKCMHRKNLYIIGVKSNENLCIGLM